MDKKDAKERIHKLRKEIEYHRTQYHVFDRASISAAALDSLKKELVDLETQFPEFLTADSPSQRVGGRPLKKFRKVSHVSRMLSLNDAFSVDELQEWERRCQRVMPQKRWTFFAEPKIDGLAVTLHYERGMLTVGATRGDGIVGEDVTQNIKTIESIPLRLAYLPSKSPQRIEIRGEVYLDNHEFDRINRERARQELPPYQNPRNTASGAIRQLDPAQTASRRLAFLAYGLPTDVGQSTHADEHALLRKMGFRTDRDAQWCSSIDDVWKFCERMRRKREKFSYQLDGVVVMVNENDLLHSLGVVGKAPRGALAVKFPAKQATTIVEDIQVQVGRTGALTPVAHLRPISIAGSIVKRATLHNVDEIERLDVKIGDTVVLQKAGDIIPDIVKVLKRLRSGNEKKFRMPRVCPSCGSPVVRRNNEVAFVCSNASCFAQHKEQLTHFVSKKGMDIAGLGPKILDQLWDAGLVKTPADLFMLQEDDLRALDRFADVSAKKTIASIQKSRRVKLARFIYALGIRHVGEQTAYDLAERFRSFERLMIASREDLEAVTEVGPVVASSIIEFFRHAPTRSMLRRLQKNIIVEMLTKTPLRSLDHQAFLFTGTLRSMTRDEAESCVRDLGGTVAQSVSRKLNYLVAGDTPGSKLAKAEKLGIPILTEKDFLRILHREA